MNTKAISLILFIAVILTLINLTSLAYAQDPTTEPTTAPIIEPTAEPAPTPEPPPPSTDPQDPVDIVVGIIAAVGALVTNFIITFIKTIPYLSDPDKDKLATAATEVVSVVVGLITGYVLALAAQALGVIDDASIKTMAIAALTPVLAEARYRVVKLAPK